MKVKVPEVRPLMDSAVVVSWRKGATEFNMFVSYTTPIALRVWKAGEASKWYALKTNNPKARSNTTMRQFKAFVSRFIFDPLKAASVKLNELPEVEAEVM